MTSRYNSARLAHIDSKSGNKTLWDEVRRLTGKKARHPIPDDLTPDKLNRQYSFISTDSLYSPPPLKQFQTSPSITISEREVFRLLDTLSSTATGPDELPFWYLHVAAPVISNPLTHLIQISIANGIVPSQWKSAIIHPIPKIPDPKTPTDLRPISVVPVLSCLTERLVVCNFLNPALLNLPGHLNIFNQFAHRPTSSTTAALISILSCITELLLTNTHVFCISFDYSKAFDTLSHSSVAYKLSDLIWQSLTMFTTG